MPSDQLTALARWAAFDDPAVAKTAFSAMRSRAELVPALCTNPALDDDSVFAIVNASTAPRDLARLVDRPLSDGAIDAVLSKKRPASVLLAMIKANRLSVAQIAKLPVTGGNVGATLADQAIAGVYDAETVAAHVRATGAMALLKFCAHMPGLAEAWVRDQLLSWETWQPGPRSANVSSYLQQVVTRFPTLVDVLVDLGGRPATAAAGSLYLTDVAAQTALAGLDDDDDALVARKFQLVALAYNPVTDRELLRRIRTRIGTIPGLDGAAIAASRSMTRPQLVGSPRTTDDQQVLAHLVTRARVSEFRPEGRPLEALELLVNPHLDDRQRESLLAGFPPAAYWLVDIVDGAAEALEASGRRRLPRAHVPFRSTPGVPDAAEYAATDMDFQMISAPDVRRFCAAAAAELGTDREAFDTLLSMLPFDGSPTELLRTARLL